MWEQSRQLKRKMLKTAIIILISLAVVFCAILILDYINRPTSEIPEGFYRFEPSYPEELDVREDREYLETDRLVEYCANPDKSGLREKVTDENRKQFDAGVLFICDWLNTIVTGDHEAYNACFSDQYWLANEAEGNYRKTELSQQMLYNIRLTFLSMEISGSDKLITYELEYSILHNDGTYRDDIGSGVSRPQRVTVRVGADGSAVIEKLVTVHTLRENIVIGVVPVLIAVGAILLVAAVVIVIVVKKRKKAKKLSEEDTDFAKEKEVSDEKAANSEEKMTD